MFLSLEAFSDQEEILYLASLSIQIKVQYCHHLIVNNAQLSNSKQVNKFHD